MRVVISGYVGKKKTGVGRTLENILFNFPLKKNDEIYLYCNYDFQDFDLKKIPLQIIVHRYKVSKNSPILNLLWHQIIYPFKTLFIDADVSYISNATLLLLKFRPTVVVIHDLIEFNVPKKFSWLRMFYRKFAFPVTAKRADKIITVSENSKSDIIKYCKVPPNKINVIYNGVDKNFFSPRRELTAEIKREYRLPDKYILFVGTIDHPGKNVYSLILACRKLWEENIGIKLVLIGQKGVGYEVISDTITRYDLNKYVLHLDCVEDRDLAAIYNGAELFCFLSLYEGFGLPLIESMACGTPVIASKMSSLPEVVGDAGIIVNPCSIDEISRKIKDVLTNDVLKNKLRRKGLERAKLFSWQKAAYGTYRVLEEVSRQYHKREG
ncbi:MAG TPA: glycosyltransferase family 1 protein [Candidatus Scalindua sp.]|nr:glycosyltransferase family 1 protein [Candidatus Scalindua sp.]